MHNNFLYISNDTLDNNLENIIHSLITLPNNQFHDISILKTIASSDNVQNIDQLSNLTINLVDRYLYLDTRLFSLPVLSSDSKNFFDTLTINAYSSNDMYKITSNFSFRDFLYKNFIKNAAYKQELQDLMILSYLYTNSVNKSYKKNDENLLLYFYQQILGNKTIQTYDDEFETRKIYDKINNFKLVATPAMMSLWGKKAKRYATYDISSKYDIEIFLLLINSTNKIRNPYVSFMKKNTSATNQSKGSLLANKLINIELFLKDLSKISLTPNLRNNILKYLPSEQNSFNNRKALCIYNQYILERLTNINFINKLYSIKKDKNLSNEDIIPVLSFISSPMLRNRLTILDYLEHSNFFSSKNFQRDKTTFIETVFAHQIMCAIPIAIITFHYLMSLLSPEKRHSYLKTYIENYSYDNNFFTYDKKQTTIIPQQTTFSSIDTQSNDYKEFLDMCYRKFFMYTMYYDNHNFNEQLSKHMQKRYLYTIKDLSSVSIPLDEHNPEGIETGTLSPNSIFSNK